MVRLYPDDIYFRAFVDAGRSTTKKLSYLLNDVCARSFILMVRLGTWGARWAMVVQQLFASQITCACITMNVCHIVQYSNQGYIPVYSVPCDPLHRQGTFWWLCLQLLDNGSLVSAVDTVKADVVSFHKK